MAIGCKRAFDIVKHALSDSGIRVGAQTPLFKIPWLFPHKHIAIPWPKTYKMPDLEAASSVNLEPSFL